MTGKTLAVVVAAGLSAAAGAKTVAEWTFDAKGAPRAVSGELTLVRQENGTYSCDALRGAVDITNEAWTIEGVISPQKVPKLGEWFILFGTKDQSDGGGWLFTWRSRAEGETDFELFASRCVADQTMFANPFDARKAVRRWRHYALVYDRNGGGEPGRGSWTFYLDGQKAKTIVSESAGGSSAPVCRSRLLVGGRTRSQAMSFAIAALRVSDRALRPAEFLNRGKPAAGLPPPTVSVPGILCPDREFTRLPFNTPGTVEIGCGYLAFATPVDADGDGDWDLAVSGSGYGGGAMYYENPGDAAKTGILRKGVRGRNVCAGWRFAMREDGGYALTAPDRIVRSQADHAPGPAAALGVGLNNVHWGRVRCNSWLSKDFDGDGRDDILVGVGDWREYGWHQSYDGIRQAWTNGRCRGLVYLLKDLAKTGDPKWSEPALLRIENGEPVETMGNPHPMLEDWDGDGDLDLILSDFPGNYTYFENVGTRTKPVYTSGRLLHDSKGALLAADECIPVPQAIDWDGDGRLDILAAEEDSRVGFYRNTGRLERGLPVFDPPVFLRAERDDLHFGILVSPYVCDFDGDGDQDIVVGDAAGCLAWFENLSGPGVARPKWEGPHYLSCAAPGDGYSDITVRPDTLRCRPFKHRAGHNGSIQGPVEAGFGYTCESVADWDGDGDLDIIYNNTWGKPMLLENVGTRTKPRFAAPRGIEVEWGEGGQPELGWAWLTPKRTGNPKEIVTQWRTTPVMIDLNGDGLMDLVMSDTEGYLAYFERFRENGKLKLRAPRRAFLDAKTGRPMGVTGWGEGNGRGTGGNAGRRKICFADWDGDGRLDLLMNGSRNVVLWTQVASADGTWSFRREGELTEQRLAAHSTCPAACDFDGDGVPDLVLGVEDGYLYHLENPRGRGKAGK